MELKTRAQAKAELANLGQSITSWSLANGYPANLVFAILHDNPASPKYKCLRGHSHNIAVALGLKQGQIFKPAGATAAA